MGAVLPRGASGRSSALECHATQGAHAYDGYKSTATFAGPRAGHRTGKRPIRYVLQGGPTLISDAGEQMLTPGLCAGFPASVADGHHPINRSSAPAIGKM